MKFMTKIYALSCLIIFSVSGEAAPSKLTTVEERWLVLQANIARKENRQEEAIRLYKKLLASSPTNATYLFQLSQLYMQSNQAELAVPLLEQALRLSPDDQDIRLALAYVYLYSNDLNKSQELFETILENSPQYADAWVGLGRVEALKGHLKQAEKFYRQALALNPHQEEALTYLNQLFASPEQQPILKGNAKQEEKTKKLETRQEYK